MRRPGLVALSVGGLMLAPDAYHDRPIALRNPIVFYEGHIPAFAVNTLIKLALRRDGIDDDEITLGTALSLSANMPGP